MSQDTFVGREDELAQYRKFLDEENSWMLVITGLGGIGKSTLLHRFTEQTPADTSFVILNFAEETSLRTDPLKLLETLALSLQFEAFRDTLQKDHDQIERYNTQLQQRLQESNAPIAEGAPHTIIAKAEDVSTFVEHVHLTMLEVQRQVRELATEAFYTQMDTFQMKRLVIMFDTGELLNEPESWEVNQWLMNEFLPRLHAHMYQAGQNCFIVFASRIPPQSQVIDEQDQQHIILSMLDKSAVDQYLVRAGMHDAALRQRVYELTHGHALCVSIVGTFYHTSGELLLNDREDALRLQQEFDEHASIELINERVLNNLASPFKELTQYGVLLRSFNLPLLKAVFPELLPEQEALDLFAQFIHYPYIESLGNYRYAFHELIREVLAKKVRKDYPEEWKSYHKKALNFFTPHSGAPRTSPSVEWYYHTLAYAIACDQEKEGMTIWRDAVQEAHLGRTRKDAGPLLQVAYDQTLELSPGGCAERDYEQGRSYYYNQQWEAALNSYKQAFGFFEQVKDQQGQATVARAIGDVQRAQGKLDAALQSYQEARAFYETVEDRPGLAKVLQAIGSVLQSRNELKTALDSYEQAFQLFGQEDDRLGQADVSRAMGDIQCILDRREAALQSYKQAIALYEEAGSDRGKTETERVRNELYAVYVIASPADVDLVARLKDDLRTQGITIWADREAVQTDTAVWTEELRRIMRIAQSVLLIASPNTRNARKVKDELRIAQMYQRPVYVVWIAGTQWMDAAPLGWGGKPYIDAREPNYETALSEVVRLLRKAPLTLPKTVGQDFEPRNPYKGLRAFEQEDSSDFFGRDQLVNELVGAVKEELAPEQNTRLLAVIGPSGSGKSSVVMAGLLPQLQQGILPGSGTWVYLERMVPGQYPIQALALTLASRLAEQSLQSILADLQNDSARGLHLLASLLTKSSAVKVILFVDQFEELFTQAITEDERKHFINLLVTAITEPNGPTIVILTMRADFYDRPLSYSVLSRLIQKHTCLLLPMDGNDLRSVIENPAALPDVQLTFEGDLIGDLLFEVQGQVGALPLLQFTLDQLFQRRDGHQLTLEAYREIGGIKGALAKHADSAYASLPSDEHRRMARALFMRLIDPGTTVQDTTRRRASLAELSLPDARQTRLLQEAADAFIAARLLTSNETAGTSTLEVSHEALIREWSLLATWLQEARDDIHLQQAISQDVAAWEARGKPKDRLYRGSQLAEASKWASRNIPSKNELEFLKTCDTQRTRNRVNIVITIVTILLSLFTAGLASLQLSLSNASTATVTSLNDAGPGSLRQAIVSAKPGDTVTFAANLTGKTIMLTSSDLNISKTLTLSGPGAGTLAISSSNNGYRVRILPHASVVILGLTFKDSSNFTGANQSFIYNEGILTFTNSVITHNTATNGGGITNQGSLTLSNSSVSNNAAVSGGGITNQGTLTLINSIVSGNTAVSGGGITNQGTLTITNSTISNNRAVSGGNGGGIYNAKTPTLTTSTLALTDSTVSGNAATSGGGIYSDGSLMLTNSTISGNAVTADGGGIIVNSGQTTIIFCTIANNSANYGGGISIKNGTLKMSESIVARNRGIGPVISGTLISNGYNLIQNLSGTTFSKLSTRHSTDIAGDTYSYLGIDSVLRNNKGSTQTYALLAGSPAIDAIPVDVCLASNISTDQRGVKRPQGPACDIGAYESSAVTFSVTPTPTDTPTPTVDVSGATSTIATFCQFLNSGAIQQAYNLTSQNYQNQHSVSDFTNQFSNMNISNGGCLYNISQVSGNNVVVPLTVNRVNPNDGSSSSTSYIAILVQDPQSGTWMIDSIQ